MNLSCHCGTTFEQAFISLKHKRLWIQKEFTKWGIKCIVVHPKDIPTTAKERDRKSDPMDASKIAVELETGRLVPIYILDSEHFHFRSLCRNYYQSVQNCTRSKCRITEIINFYGIEVPKHSSKWPKRITNELYEIPLDDGPQKLTFDICLDDLVHHRSKQVRTLKAIKTAIADLGFSKLLENIETILGIGFKTAMTYKWRYIIPIIPFGQ